jgi:hypothetical protein
MTKMMMTKRAKRLITLAVQAIVTTPEGDHCQQTDSSSNSQRIQYIADRYLLVQAVPSDGRVREVMVMLQLQILVNDHQISDNPILYMISN